ncbi:hypothetical protein M413DRAFT_68614 [Hebeloma cylindrosporum]|uniref:Carbohydrate kinase PfkB domain-containing protein n=1 Tax=Hebeloma cylindrosporum TaxID=76867 RepID=A0A0C3C404_HEBCY|nr:hypothetical protein M413DRAFT_68614 [Hebeloma cylindrosporum h7]
MISRLPPSQIGMIVDKGPEFPASMEASLMKYGQEMWTFRNHSHHATTRVLNSYKGENRRFEYNTPRIRLTPKDLIGTDLANPKVLHFICSPARASAIMSEVQDEWSSITVYEPIPDSCIPEELPALKKVLPLISVLSPNAEEALSLVSLPLPPTKDRVEKATDDFLDIGVGKEGNGWVIIRCGALGAYLKSRATTGQWIEAFWTEKDGDKVVDVTGAGNSFLGGFAAGLRLSGGDVYEATLHASISASFIIEQEGLPAISEDSMGRCQWNGDVPSRRLDILRKRHNKKDQIYTCTRG